MILANFHSLKSKASCEIDKAVYVGLKYPAGNYVWRKSCHHMNLDLNHYWPRRHILSRYCHLGSLELLTALPATG